MDFVELVFFFLLLLCGVRVLKYVFLFIRKFIKAISSPLPNLDVQNENFSDSERLDCKNNHSDAFKCEEKYEHAFTPQYLNPEFLEVLERRGIKYLLHFTRVENLESIFSHGFLPVSSQKLRGISAVRSDVNRFDGVLDGTSFSVMFPNYKMFYQLRTDNPLSDYAVLAVDANVLCDFEALFYPSNAAATFGGGSVDDFEKMFSDYPGFISRHELGIRDCYTTDPQSEIIIKGDIPAEYIKGVYFNDPYVCHVYSKFIPSWCQRDVSYSLFKYRSDYEYWRGKYIRSYSCVCDNSLSFEEVLNYSPSVACHEPYSAPNLVSPPVVEVEAPVVSCRTCFDYVSGACFGAVNVCGDYRYTGGRELI